MSGRLPRRLRALTRELVGQGASGRELSLGTPLAGDRAWLSPSGAPAVCPCELRPSVASRPLSAVFSPLCPCPCPCSCLCSWGWAAEARPGAMSAPSEVCETRAFRPTAHGHACRASSVKGWALEGASPLRLPVADSCPYVLNRCPRVFKRLRSRARAPSSSPCERIQ